MQQVGGKAAASSIAIDPRRLPFVPDRRRPRPLANIRRTWVLHRQRILRGLMALACLVLLVGAYQGRSVIVQTAGTAGQLLQGRFAAAGLGIGEIAITGQVMTREADVAEALGIDESTWILGFNAAAARQRLLDLPAVSEATVRKIYPNQLQVTLTEKTPVARWRAADGDTWLIDAGGNRLAEALPVDDNLPLVIGEGAADDALVMIRAMQRYPGISNGLVALSRLADRRWDMIYKSGLRVRLPESGVAQALKRLNTYQQEHQLLDRDLTRIDMRVADMLVVRPTERAQEKIEEDAG